jgi:hypothetical protein
LNWSSEFVKVQPPNLNLPSCFNQPVGHQGCEDINCPRNLPNSITHLTFGYYFNQPVDNLPNSITHLTFGESFNQPVNNLPNSIVELVFGFNFCNVVSNLPITVKKITIHNKKTHLFTKIPFDCNINF